MEETNHGITIMSRRDVGIRYLIPGHRSPEEIREDENTRRRVQEMLDHSPEVTTVEPLGEILARTAPLLDLGLTPKEKPEAPKGFKSQKEYENHLTKSPTKRDHERAFNMGDKIIKVSKAERDRGANEWITGGGRDPKGRSLDQEIKLGKDRWIKNQKTTNPVKPKAMPVTTYINKLSKLYGNAEDANNRVEKGKPLDPTQGSKYVEWYDRMAQEEAEALNNVKRQTWEQGGRVRPEPKYVSAQDVKNVYSEPKKLHQRLEKVTQKPQFLYSPVKNELEDTNDPNWGNDILNDKK